MTNEIKSWATRKLSANDIDIQKTLELLLATEQNFFAFKPEFSRAKEFENRGNLLPKGIYEEFNVTPRREDSRRILVNQDTRDTYLSLCHYRPESFWYLGKVGQLDF
jgi:hypothetical protein